MNIVGKLIQLVSPERKRMIEKVMQFVDNNKVEGDYLEFGVYRGRTLSYAYKASKNRNLDMDFYAFDSFEGLPELTGSDKEINAKQGDYSCSEEQFKKYLKLRGVDLRKVCIIKGWYDKTLNQKTKDRLKVKKAAVVWVDCDIYKSAVPVLNFITSYLQQGTILVFDDWYHFKGDKNKGEQRAFSEWRQKHPEFVVTQYHKFSWGGNSFVLSRK